ncbi:unnamed protein product [Symbiodinium sp. KB8]|nr:unnamed protein product [Symbiodinium sp. KB8]
MQRSSRALLLLGACATMCWQAAFLSPAEPQTANSRRALLAAGSAGLLGAMSPKSASAADFFGLPHIPGPFEMDPKEAVVIGDAADPQVKDAKAKVQELQTQAEQALDMIQKDPQADLSFMVKEFGIGDLRDATNVINDIMDDKTAAATQRWQRLMIQASEGLSVVVFTTHRPLSSSFLWFILRNLYGNPNKEVLRGLWVVTVLVILHIIPPSLFAVLCLLQLPPFLLNW